jgi:hypothetical protein
MSAGATEVCPWDVDPALKAKRLALLARLAVETRAQAIAEADREAGDTNWGIGCKAHERFAHAVTKLSETTERSWLRVHRDGLSFVSFIEGVAVRAYHGAADRPHARHVYAAQSESHREPVDPRQLALPFAGGAAVEPSERWAWLMAMETDEEGRALRIVFFQANAAGEKRYAWVAPMADEDGPDPARPVAARRPSGEAAVVVRRRRPMQLTALV